MNSKQDYYLLKYKALKSRQPGLCVPHCILGIFNFLSTLLMLSSSAAIIGLVYATLMHSIASIEEHWANQFPYLGTLLSGNKATLISLFVTLIFILITSIAVRYLCRQVKKCNNYIAELNKFTGEIAEEKKIIPLHRSWDVEHKNKRVQI